MQVLLNLINNSKDSLIKNKISDPWIKINALDENKMLTISVEDNGKGIDKEILNKIFNPYFTTKHQSQGTGIGLYMCKKIIEGNLKGKLIANNTEVGAKFIITLQKN
ncbi:MAG: ATP-binding protein [Arcobacter sp.]|nr:ATP-binding protein [Arcobacter sp.]